LTARSPAASRDVDATSIAFRRLLPRRRSGGSYFRGSVPGPHVPLSTLRRRPCEWLRMTRGRCGSLLLHRMTLSFTTPCRFDRRTGEGSMKIVMRDGRVFQGTALQIVKAMQNIAFGVDDFTVPKYIEWVVANTLKFEELQLDVKGET